MTRIAIIHPEGNFNNNPNLAGLLSLLTEQGYLVDLYAQPRAEIDQSPPASGISVVLREEAAGYQHDTPVLLPSIVRADPLDAARSVAKNLPRPDLVIGIDRGIIEASALGRVWGCPIGLISYEIFFESETSPAFKAPEIESCRGLAFTVCQDRDRSTELSRENRIPLDSIIDTPVAGRGIRPGRGSGLLRAALSLQPETRIALYMGELSGSWNGIDEILESTVTWPDGWALVLHHRYGNGAALDLVEKVLKVGRKNVFFSPFPTLPFDRMGELLYEVDLGFAFYRPVPGHPSSNKNLVHIGMASGKISTYLQHGVPVVVNEIGEISNHIRANGLGGVVQHGSELPALFDEFARNPSLLDGKKCLQFFGTTLDLNVTAQPLLITLRELVTRAHYSEC